MTTTSPKPKKLRPLFDCDGIVYASGHSNNKEDSPLSHALHSAKLMIEKSLSFFDVPRDECRLFLTGSGNFRIQRATIKPYKGNRKEEDRPRWYKEIREYILDFHYAELVEGVEADDAIATAQWAAKDNSTCIVSRDKDFRCVPGHHFDPAKEEFFYVRGRDADLFHLRQMVEGDTADNVPGIPGYGPVKSQALIACGSIPMARFKVQELYQQHYGETWESAYQEISDLLWLRRSEEYKQCPFLWR